MKKIFTLVALACAAISANAQESWHVNNEDGTLKADYVANEDANAMSVVKFSTANVEGTHTSGPVAGYNDGPTTPLEPKVDNTWGNISKKALSKDDSVPPFYYVQGKGNPVNLEKIAWEEIMTDGVGTGTFRANWTDSYYAFDGSAGLPKNGTYVTLTPKVAGTLKVAAWINKGNRDVYVAKASDAKALVYGTECKVSGYINGQNWEIESDENPLKGYPELQEELPTKGEEGTDAFVIGAGNQAAWVYFTFAATAGETYYIFCKNTQIGFSGFEFTAGGADGINSVSNANSQQVAAYFTANGARVSAPVKGINLVKYADGTTKKIIKK
ncbi:MAG: hypothetical protein ACI4BA_07380 [Prevotella sp.]